MFELGIDQEYAPAELIGKDAAEIHDEGRTLIERSAHLGYKPAIDDMRSEGQ
jgi:hypothetical protein